MSADFTDAAQIKVPRGKRASRPGSPRARRYAGEEYRRVILEAAIEMFGRFGYDGTSTRMVASAAGMEQGHFTYFYPSKERLWQDAVTTFASGIVTLLTAACAASLHLDIEDRVLVVLPKFLDHCADNPRLTRLMLQEFSIDSPRNDWVVERFGRPVWAILRPLFEDLHTLKRLSGGPPAMAYFNFIGAALIAFGNTEVTFRISGLDATGDRYRVEQVRSILSPILAPA